MEGRARCQSSWGVHRLCPTRLNPLTRVLLLRGDDESLDMWMADEGQGQRQREMMRDAQGKAGGASGGVAAEPVVRSTGGLGRIQKEAGRGSRGLGAAASLAVALGKLLWRCEGRLAEAVGECSKTGGALLDVNRSAGVLYVVKKVSLLSTACTELRPADGSGDGGVGEGDEGMGGAKDGDGERGTSEAVEQQQWHQQLQQQGQQQEQRAQQRRQVWVCAFAAWRCLPPLASLAERTATEGHVPRSWAHGAVLVWQPLLWWTRKVCYRYLFSGGVPTGEAGTGAGSCQVAGGSVGAAGAGDGAAAAAAAERAGECCSGQTACGCSSGCTSGRCSSSSGSSRFGREAGAGRWCGCWRDFLLRDVGVVELMGIALREVVPALPRQPPLVGNGGNTGSPDVAVGVMSACVLLMAAFPEEVARTAGSLSSDGSAAAASPQIGGSGGSCARPSPSSRNCSRSDLGASASGGTVWPPCGLARLAQLVSEVSAPAPMVRALQMLEEWCGACGEAGGPVGFDEEQRAVLRSAAAFTLGAQCGHPFLKDAGMLPPLCELRGLMQVCNNPRCAVLPPPGQTEAEAAEEAVKGRGKAWFRGCGAAWYCCARCREEHWRAGHGQACCGGAVPA